MMVTIRIFSACAFFQLLLWRSQGDPLQ